MPNPQDNPNDNPNEKAVPNLARSGHTILDTPDQIEMFHLLQMKYALKIEIHTGLRHSQGSVLKLVNDTLLKNDFIVRPLPRKTLALAALESYIEMKTKTLTDGPDVHA